MRKITLLLVVAITMTACNRPQDINDVPDDKLPSVLNHVSLGVKAADVSDLPPATKSEISITDAVYFSWSSSDIVGMFPDRGAQAYFEMTGQDGETVAEFDGGGWALKAASEYAVYYPYDYDHRVSNDIPFDYTGQVQVGVNDYSHLADYQFMAEGMQKPESGACNYSMERIEAIVIFRLTIPDVITCDKLTFRLVDGHKVVISTRLDISGAEYYVAADGKATNFTLDMEGVYTTESGQTLYFYAMMPPQDLSGHTAIISLHSTDGDNYYGLVDGKNMLNNHAYQYTATLTSDYASLMESFGIEDGFWE